MSLLDPGCRPLWMKISYGSFSALMAALSVFRMAAGGPLAVVWALAAAWFFVLAASAAKVKARGRDCECHPKP